MLTVRIRWRHDKGYDVSVGTGGAVVGQYRNRHLKAIGAALRRRLRELPDHVGTVLDLDAQSAAVWWEDLVVFPPPAVRSANALPTVGLLPMTLPLRVLEVDSGPSALDAARNALHHAGQDSLEGPLAMVAATTVDELVRFPASRFWPTVDVLRIGAREDWSVRRGRPDERGTFGWLERFVRRWSTRLVILQTSRKGARGALMVAWALVERGGPAVLVAPAGEHLSHYRFYEPLIADGQFERVLRYWRGTAAFTGQGRGDLLEMIRPVDELTTAWVRQPEAAGRRWGIEPEAGSHLDMLAADWAGLHPSEQPIEALCFAAGQLRAVRAALGPGPRVAREAPRHVNVKLLHRADPELVPVPDDRPLTVGAWVYLEVGIGPIDVRSPGFRRRAVVDEAILWNEQGTGAWLTVAVTGVDFEVGGAAEQPLWLPRHGPAVPCVIAVRPKRAGRAALRFTLFSGNHALQSFRLVARTGAQPDGDEALADALGLEPTEVAGTAWAYRLDFAMEPDLGAGSDLPPRALGIVANDLDGRVVISVKTDELFTAKIENDIAGYVSGAREALASWSDQAGHYPFEQNNDGPDRLKAALAELARAGYELRHAVLPMDVATRQHVGEVLAGIDEVIHVAHVERHEVVPWSLVYDLELDPDAMESDGQPLAHDVCLAALPRADGTLPVTRCKTAANCLKLDERRRDDTVVCPLGFWGFRHTIEMPPKALRVGQPPGAARRSVIARSPLTVAAGFNEGLKLADEHERAMAGLIDRDKTPVTVRRGASRDEVLAAIADLGLQVVYFYCHASGAKVPPFLEFQRRGGAKGVIHPANLEVRLENQLWTCHPLVVLNGCRTAAFDPTAMSPFVETLVENRSAAAVIGTEVSVHEALATEVGRALVAGFVRGEQVGDVIRTIRRKLLARHNPLGLAYTLYGVAELRLSSVRDSPPEHSSEEVIEDKNRLLTAAAPPLPDSDA